MPRPEIERPPEDFPPRDFACIRSVGSTIHWGGRHWSWTAEGWRHVPHRDDPPAEVGR